MKSKGNILNSKNFILVGFWKIFSSSILTLLPLKVVPVKYFWWAESFLLTFYPVWSICWCCHRATISVKVPCPFCTSRKSAFWVLFSAAHVASDVINRWLLLVCNASGLQFQEPCIDWAEWGLDWMGQSFPVWHSCRYFCLATNTKQYGVN